MDVQLSGTWHAAQSILSPSPWGDWACDADIKQEQSTRVIESHACRPSTNADQAALVTTSEWGQPDRSNEVPCASRAGYIGPVYVGRGRTVDDGWQFRMKQRENPTKRACRSWIGTRYRSVMFTGASCIHYLWQSLHSCLGSLNEGTFRAGSGSGLWHFLQSTFTCLPSSG